MIYLIQLVIFYRNIELNNSFIMDEIILHVKHYFDITSNIETAHGTGYGLPYPNIMILEFYSKCSSEKPNILGKKLLDNFLDSYEDTIEQIEISYIDPVKIPWIKNILK
jgi:hypothetical protein